MESAILAGVAITVVLLIFLLFRKPKVDTRLVEFEDTVRKLLRESITEQNDRAEKANRALREEVSVQIKGVGDTLTRAVGELKDAQNQAFSGLKDAQVKTLGETRDALQRSIDEFRKAQDESFRAFSTKTGDGLDGIRNKLDERLDKVQQAQAETLGEFTKTTNSGLETVRKTLDERLVKVQTTQDEALGAFSRTVNGGMEGIRNKLDERLDKVQKELADSLTKMQTSNEQKLDEMRRTVDEKLEKTLETRLQKSFETVSTQLESVNKGLGEMSKVASEVGSLQKVLSNTKNRGIMGEIQLEMIIDDIIPPHLFDKNVATMPKSTERVEFALRLPGNEDGEVVYLPIDSKFPLEDYYRLAEAYDTGDSIAIELHRKALFGEMKKFAADIRNKYISPPHTTPFGVMFLPTEGLYAEVARNPELFESLRRSYGVIVAGPTTLSALLNSFLVGFKTLAIQKGAAHIEKTLGAAKKEFENFGTVLIRARDRIRKVDEDLGDLVGVRTKKINTALKKVQVYEGEDSGVLLGFGEDDNIDE